LESRARVGLPQEQLKRQDTS